MELRHIENVARYLRQVGYQAVIDEQGWSTSPDRRYIQVRTKPERVYFGDQNMDAEILFPVTEQQTVKILLHFREKSGELCGTYTLPVDASTIRAHGEREGIPGLLEELGREAADGAFATFERGEYPESRMAWEFITGVLSDTEDERLDLIAGGEPPEFSTFYDQKLAELERDELDKQADLATEYRARLQGAKIVFPDGMTFDLVQQRA